MANWFKRNKDPLTPDEKNSIIEKSSKQVGPGVFYSTIIVVTSFLPVFLLTGMEGKLFHPLAWTKTFILLIDAFLAITLTPVLISFFLKGRLKPESANPITRTLERIYTPILRWCLKWRKTIIGINIAALAIGVIMMTKLGSEFMPPLDEGSLLFMPVTYRMFLTQKQNDYYRFRIKSSALFRKYRMYWVKQAGRIPQRIILPSV